MVAETGDLIPPQRHKSPTWGIRGGENQGISGGPDSDAGKERGAIHRPSKECCSGATALSSPPHS